MESVSKKLACLHEELESCRKCALPDVGPHRYSGKAGNRIMLVGQAPASAANSKGMPFSGSAGRRLFEWLKTAGFEEEEFREKAYMTSITKCYPGPNPSGKGDRKPGKEEIAACRGFLLRELDIIRPGLLIPVGQLAISILVGDYKLSETVGRKFDHEFDGWSTIIVPLPHPSGASLWNNLPENKELVSQALRLIADLKKELNL